MSVFSLADVRGVGGSRPRLSVIVPARDPAYGGGLLHRAQVALTAFITLARRHDLSCEIVVVEWNPVPGAPRFRDVLSWPADLHPVVLRFIEVPPDVHARLPNADRIPFYNTRARNVGVRRARGEYILVTGADVLPSDCLVQRLARGPLSTGAFYRVDRRDLTEDIPADWSVDRQLEFCERQDVVVHTYYGSIREPADRSPAARRDRRRRHRAVLREYRRYLADPSYAGPAQGFDGDRLIIPADGLHRNASGEFLLMHRHRWHALRGYTELSTRGHGDSILCWTAASAGLTQVVLRFPSRLFHQRHDRDAAADWPVTDWRPWYARYLECRRTGTAMVENPETWGLGDAALPEWTFGHPVEAEATAAR